MFSGFWIEPLCGNSLFFSRCSSDTIYHANFSASPRLQDELMAASLKANLCKMKVDMKNMAWWALAFSEYAQRQAGLDIKYASERFNKGCSKVQSMCSEKLKLCIHEDFSNAQHEILTLCNRVGQNPTLTFRLDLTLFRYSFVLIWSAHISQVASTPLSCQLRMTLLLLDLTCWPASSWVAIILHSLGKAFQSY